MKPILAGFSALASTDGTKPPTAGDKIRIAVIKNIGIYANLLALVLLSECKLLLHLTPLHDFNTNRK